MANSEHVVAEMENVVPIAALVRFGDFHVYLLRETRNNASVGGIWTFYMINNVILS